MNVCGASFYMNVEVLFFFFLKGRGKEQNPTSLIVVKTKYEQEKIIMTLEVDQIKTSTYAYM